MTYNFRKIDAVFAAFIGEIFAWLILVILFNLRQNHTGGFIFFLKSGVGLVISLPAILPVLAVSGLYFCFLLSRWKKFFYQFGKFFLVGILNVAIDIGALNLLVISTEISHGIGFSALKGTSFFLAFINSYYWNKYWTFSSGSSQFSGKISSSSQFIRFGGVIAIGFLINVGIASSLVNIIGAPYNIAASSWINISAFIAAMITFTWHFIGAKFFVFKN